MLKVNSLLKCFGIFWVSFILLQLLVSSSVIRNGLSSLHAKVFVSTSSIFVADANVKADVVAETGDIKFEFYNQKEADRLVAEIRKTGKAGNVQLDKYSYTNSPKHHIHTALVFLIALFFATPIKWNRRLLNAAIACCIFYLFTVVRMGITIRDEISQSAMGLYTSSPDAFFSLHKISNLLGALGFIFVLVVLIWGLLVFNKQNIKQMKAQLS